MTGRSAPTSSAAFSTDWSPAWPAPTPRARRTRRQWRPTRPILRRQHRTCSPRATSCRHWTDNNAPYGITFAGFSPRDHTDLTLDDLGVPGKAEKYAAYNYLLSNEVKPTSDWAQGAADALNQKYNTTAYHAI